MLATIVFSTNVPQQLRLILLFPNVENKHRTVIIFIIWISRNSLIGKMKGLLVNTEVFIWKYVKNIVSEHDVFSLSFSFQLV